MRKRQQDKHELPPFIHSGILLVDKPLDWTSHDVVNFLRHKFNIKKVGHCGTLDPAATGLLVVVLGHATKMSETLSSSNKTYEATLLLGVETDSQDMEGEIIGEKDPSYLLEEEVRSEILKLEGEQEQIPPMFSAIKKGGKKLYDLARAGKEVEREPRKITINSVEINKIYLPKVDFEVNCSKGTYIRTICHDLGQNLGCGGTLAALRRTTSGVFQIEHSHQIEGIREWSQDKLYRAFVPF
jgi:tRNA pseudouridine55 synthase